jgi:tetratricopeptide (TPR) repeat protein
MSNKAKKGIAEIDKLVNKYPTDSRYKVLRGEIYMQQQMPAKAFEIYQQVLKSDPQNATVYVSLSEYYNQKSQPDSALQAIVMALKADGLEPDTKIQILDQYVEKLVRDSTRFVETESLFKLLVDKYPLEEQVHSYYAKFLQYQKRNKEVISELETMLNINSKNTQTWLRLIQTYIDSKDFKQMLAVADKALLTLPAEPSLYFYKGIGLFQINDYKGALETYKAGLPTIADDQLAFKSDFYAQIGDTYFKMEQKDSAFANYEKALEANPKNVMVMT